MFIGQHRKLFSLYRSKFAIRLIDIKVDQEYTTHACTLCSSCRYTLIIHQGYTVSLTRRAKKEIFFKRTIPFKILSTSGSEIYI